MFSISRTYKLHSTNLQVIKSMMFCGKYASCVSRPIDNNNIDLIKCFDKSYEAVDPRKLMHEVVKLNDNLLTIQNCDTYDLSEYKCYLVGFGKAVFNMSVEIERILGSNLVKGICSIPIGTIGSIHSPQMVPNSKIKYMEGAKDNLPDDKACKAATEIANLAEKLDKNDLLIVLISGGGSALLPFPKPPITLSDMFTCIKELSYKGADIKELNSVRKRFSVLKGGGLARIAYPAKVVSLILSDVLGDPLDLIASGPTVPNTDHSNKAIDILKKYELNRFLKDPVFAPFYSEVDEDKEGKIPITSSGCYAHAKNYIIGNNVIAAESAKKECVRRGYDAFILSVNVDGDVNAVSKFYKEIALEVAQLVKGYSSVEFLEDKLKSVKDALHLKDDAVEELLKADFHSTKGKEFFVEYYYCFMSLFLRVWMSNCSGIRTIIFDAIRA